MMKRFFAAFFALLFLGFLGWQIYLKVVSARKSSKLSRGAMAVAVEIMPVERTDIRDVRQFTGTLYAKSSVIIAPKISGRLEKLLFNIGDKIEQGQIIARLDDEELLQQIDQSRAALEVAKATLHESRSNLEIAKRQIERTIALREKKIASESDLDEARSSYTSQEAKLKVAEAQVIQREAAYRTDRVRLSYTQIRMPSNSHAGYWVVGERYVDEGAMLASNAPILSVFDISSVMAVIYVIERDYARMQIGLESVAITDAYPGLIFSGKIARVAPILRETSREARIEIEIQNSEGFLKPGMFVRVQIEFDYHDNVRVVPLDALVKRNGTVGVFTADLEEKKAYFVPVVPGIVNGTLAEITSPPLSGYVVTLGHHLLENGASIMLPAGELKRIDRQHNSQKAPKKEMSSPAGSTP